MEIGDRAGLLRRGKPITRYNFLGKTRANLLQRAVATAVADAGFDVIGDDIDPKPGAQSKTGLVTGRLRDPQFDLPRGSALFKRTPRVWLAATWYSQSDNTFEVVLDIKTRPHNLEFPGDGTLRHRAMLSIAQTLEPALLQLDSKLAVFIKRGSKVYPRAGGGWNAELEAAGNAVKAERAGKGGKAGKAR